MVLLETAKVPVPGTKPAVSYCTCQDVSLAQGVHEISTEFELIFEATNEDEDGSKHVGVAL